ncbi:MAG: Holliday junction branch migration protein RuvA [Armatimonadota bacterium]
MIAQLTGTVVHAGAPHVVLDVHGVGYKVAVPLSVLEHLPKNGEPVTLLTHMLVREDDLSRYGFLDAVEREVFEHLLSVSGVGPKVALAILSALGGAGLARLVATDDVRGLVRVPGIGSKTAQRLILELRDQLGGIGLAVKADALAPSKAPEAKPATVVDDVVSALVNLGYNRGDAGKAADAAADAAEGADFATLLRAALNRLTR